MKNDNKFGLKDIIISAFIFSIIIVGDVFMSSACIADEVAVVRPTYEQIIKQYPSMEQYIVNARRNIKENWYPSPSSFEHSATMVLKISKDGELLDSYISVSSNDKKFDNSLLDAAQKVKFAPLPNDVKEESVDIDLSFEMKRRRILK